MGEAGCVSWLFDKKGVITINQSQIAEDDLMELVLEAGADDMKLEDDTYEIVTSPANFEQVKRALEEHQVKYENAELTMHPQNTVKIDGKNAEQLLKIMDALEDHDDVNHVYSNFDIDIEILQQLEQG